ncbi:MAG: diphthamide synthesis protein, partial [Candidatus Thermoplasmatota archaeon]|nr:diphthamide synthesis protein [Candidatus Thermoplasmatota archaeon]
MLEDFHFDLDVLLEELEKRGWTKIAVQAPEGLMRSAIELSRAMGGLGLETIVLVNPCYGACDLAQTPEGFHGVVHLGHAHFPGQDAVFVELPSKADNLGAIEENCHLMPDRIGLAATVQHLGLLENAKTILEKCGKRAYIGQGRGRSVHGGQVLGCNLSSARDVEAEVDAFLFIGTGRFHPEGMAMSTGKKV